MDDFERLLQPAIKFLAIRARSQKEVKDYLRKKTSDGNLINQIIDKLTGMGLIDDRKFAQWLIESRSRSRPRGQRLLINELKSKGINLDRDSLRIDEPALAQTALTPKLRLWLKLPYREFRVKAGRFLASRGFSWEVIEKVVKAVYNNPHVN